VKELGLQGFVALLLLTVAIMAVIYRLTYEQDMRSQKAKNDSDDRWWSTI
jgi:preprotein translocase subunit YajC